MLPSQPAISDLELELSSHGHAYQLRLDFKHAVSLLDDQRGPFAVALDEEKLLNAASDPVAYGAELTAQVFAEAEARFRETLRIAYGDGLRVRMRLRIPDRLQHIWWETLQEPDSRNQKPGPRLQLATSGRVLLSRYLNSDERLMVRPPRHPLRAVAAIAAPEDIATYQLGPIDAEAELERARAILSDTNLVTLGDPHGTPATWDALNDTLRTGIGCDILYLVAHGEFKPDQGKETPEPWLFLVNDRCKADKKPGNELVKLLRGLNERRPLLVVLASCESAGDGYGATVSALGPQLVRAGVPAVIAMQGKVDARTAYRFAEVFFEELRHDGSVDRSANMARLAVAGQPDWWKPVLYTRLREGRLWPDRMQATFYGEFELPSVHIERSELLAQLRERLLPDPQSLTRATSGQVKRPIALHGMGGVGKSVLARALCAEPVVQAAFPDGIFWITLGQEDPDLVRPLRAMVERLGDPVTDSVPTPRSLKAQLVGLLEHKACLIVADDVWDPGFAEYIPMGGTRCRVLITTRDSELVRPIGAEIFPVPVMDTAQARALLRKWSQGSLDSVNDALVDQIAGEVGALPLALRLAGSQLQTTEPVQWLKEFDIRKLREQRGDRTKLHSSLERTLRISLDALTTEDRGLCTSLAIFREDAAIPDAVIARLWSELGGLDASSSRELLRDLAARALLDLRVGPDGRRVVLHDLVRDLLEIELGADQLVATHRQLLASYNPSAGRWHVVADDGYIYDSLAYHLQQAQMYPDLLACFADQEWLKVRFAQSDFSYAGYLRDLERACQAALQQTASEGGTFNAQSLSDLFRLVLIHVSINSLIYNFVPELVVRAVETGLWSMRRALDLVRASQGRDEGLKLYRLLRERGLIDGDVSAAPGGTPEDQQPEPGASQTTPFEAAEQRLRDALVKLGALPPDAPLALADAPELLGRLLGGIADSLGEAQSVQILEAIAPFLVGADIDTALLMIKNLSDEADQTRIIRAMSDRLDAHQTVQALAIAETLQNPRARTLVFGSLARQVLGEQRQVALLKAAAAAEKLGTGTSSTWFLSEIAPQLEQESLDRAIKIGVHDTAADDLGFLTWKLGQTLTPEPRALVNQLVYELTLHMRNIALRVQRLAELAPQLQANTKAAALDYVCEYTGSLEDDWSRRRLISALIKAQEPRCIRCMLQIAGALTEPLEYYSAIQEIKEFVACAETVLPEGPEQELNAAVLRAQTLVDGAKKDASTPTQPGTTQGALPPRQMVTPESPLTVDELLDLVEQGQYKHWSASWDKRLAGPVTMAHLERAISIVTTSGDWPAPLNALQKLITIDQLVALLRDAEQSRDGARRSVLLMLVIPRLDPADMGRALVVAEQITSEAHKFTALSALVSYLDSAYFEQVLRQVEAMHDHSRKVSLLKALTPKLGPVLWRRVLDQIEPLTSYADTADILKALVPRLEVSLLPRILQIGMRGMPFMRRAGLFEALLEQLGRAPELRPALGRAIAHMIYEQRFLGLSDFVQGHSHTILLRPPLCDEQTVISLALHLHTIGTMWRWK